jgi:hypothetical protein
MKNCSECTTRKTDAKELSKMVALVILICFSLLFSGLIALGAFAFFALSGVPGVPSIFLGGVTAGIFMLYFALLMYNYFKEELK